MHTLMPPSCWAIWKKPSMFDTTKWSMCTPVTDSTVSVSNSCPAWLAPAYRALVWLIFPMFALTYWS